MNQQELDNIIDLHRKHLYDEKGGVKANLYKAYLPGAYLPGVDLSRANLSRVDLSRANLSGANLSRANLSGANLSGANLYKANLYKANLSGANLSRANLYEANLSGAYLFGANLYEAKGFVCFLNLKFPVYVFEHATLIGCKYNSNQEWLKIAKNPKRYMDKNSECLSAYELDLIRPIIRRVYKEYNNGS